MKTLVFGLVVVATAACSAGGGTPLGGAGGTPGGSSGSGGNGGTTTGPAGSSSSGTSSSGTSSSGTTSSSSSGTPAYDLPPPNPCSNKFATQDCMKGVASSACEGVCANSYGGTAANVCAGGSTGIPVNYACPRHLLYSDEMIDAASKDGFAGKLNYGIVGHDPDSTGIDKSVNGGGFASCCQCYQLVFDYPKENQAWLDPNNTASPSSAITAPRPIVVQSANTATNGPDDFDIFMGAGGFGANNGCYVSGGACPGGPCMYTAFPSYNGGGLNVAGNGMSNLTPNPCKTSTQWVTEASLTSSACATETESACSKITSANAQIQAVTQRSCVESNGVKADDQGTVPGDYHLNWYVWAKRVECPDHLTQVTGCKLAPQGLPKPDPAVQTVAQAKTAGFAQTAGTGTQFSTTQMQDCCMPSCAWADNVKTPTTGGYTSFYSCDLNGTPWTTAVKRTP